MSRRLRAIPLPLALILGFAAVASATWSLVIPALQGADEVSHFSYTQKIVETGEIPWKPGGGTNPAGVFITSDEVVVAQDQAGLGPLAANVGARPLWTAVDERVWEEHARGLTERQRENGGFTTSFKNPPLYYLYQAVPYALAKRGSFFDRQFAMRLANIPLLLFGLVFVWLVSGALLGRGPAQVLATSSAALLPQLTNVSAGVNPDVLLAAEWSAALYLMLLLVREGPRPLRTAALGAVCVAAALTHARSLPLFLPAAITIVVTFARARGIRSLTPARVTVGALTVFTPIVLFLSARGNGSLREFVSYVWQFYLPRLGFMTPKIGPDDYGFREAYIERMYGTLAQLEVTLPPWLADVTFWATVVIVVALAAVLVKRRNAVRHEAAFAWVIVAAVVALLLGLHLAAYRAMLGAPADPIVTARYLLPLLPLLGTAVGLIAASLPRRPSYVFAGLVLAAGVALQFESLGLLVERFYA